MFVTRACFRNEVFSLYVSDNTCVVSNLTDHRFNIFNFTTDASGGHVKGVKDILMFGKQFGETYMGGSETVGVLLRHI